jgi:hypothetical protein
VGEETQAASQQDRPLSSSRVPLVALMLESRARLVTAADLLSTHAVMLGLEPRLGIILGWIACLLLPLQYCI